MKILYRIIVLTSYSIKKVRKENCAHLNVLTFLHVKYKYCEMSCFNF